MHVYKEDWNFPRRKEEQNALRIEALEPTWDLSAGLHPDVDIPQTFYDPQVRNPYQLVKEAHLPELLNIHPQGATTGHTMMADKNTISLVQPNNNAPIAPIFVRDLAGRIIYIGTTKHKQEKPEKAYLFPQGSLLFSEKNKGFDLLEKVFFCPFRFIEYSESFMGDVSGKGNTKACSIYFGANLYPYKLRPDTFYQDGWRIPQTELLFVLPESNPIAAESAGSELINLWFNRPSGQTYEDFCTEHEELFFTFFSKGCTLIPTIEGFNGFNQVEADFTHQGFWPGRAVPHLHDIVGQKDSEAPTGTILEVLDPGYITLRDIVPARVIISNGKHYKSPTQEEETQKKRLYPDLRLPHQRTSAKWGATWLPTHPCDFEDPAIWGWDFEYGNGRFMQLRGPIWDPLHYYYACTPAIIHAFETNRLKRNLNLVKVPDAFFTRFWPVTGLRGFDTFNVPLKEARREAATLLPTSILWKSDASAITDVGYHPLPTHYEYELDPWWLPDLAPKHRVSPTIPLNIENYLASVIEPKISAEKFLATVVANAVTHPWFTDSNMLIQPTQKPQENYPDLMRYLNPTSLLGQDIVHNVFSYLEDVDLDDLPLASFDVNLIRSLEDNWPGVYQAFLTCNPWATAFVTARHTLFKNEDKNAKAFWNIKLLKTLLTHNSTQKDEKAFTPSAAFINNAS